MGDFSETQEDIADVFAGVHDGMKPLLILIINLLEKVAVLTDISQVVALLVNDTEIKEGFGAFLHNFKGFVEVFFITHQLQGTGIRQGDQLGDTFIEKQVNGPPAIFGQSSQGFHHLLLILGAEVAVEDNSQEEQGNDAKDDDGQGDLETELFVGRFRHGKPFRCLSVIIALQKWNGPKKEFCNLYARKKVMRTDEKTVMRTEPLAKWLFCHPERSEGS